MLPEEPTLHADNDICAKQQEHLSFFAMLSLT
jgi:hypothetical protein